jgi:hypothetical protein
MAAEVGDLQGASWTTLDQGETYTRQLRIDDADSKQLATFNSVSLVNLAGVVTTELTINPLILQYTVGGFVQRTVFVNAWTDGSTPSQREASIGTEVGDTSKLVVTIGSSAGAFTNTLTTYTSPSNPATTNYAVTGPSGVLNSTTGNLIFVRDTLLASGNVTGTLPVIVEETT